MSDLRSIAALYEQVDNHFDDLRDDFDEAGRERVEQEQRINDQAYFVLAWGQLEADAPSSLHRKGIPPRQRRFCPLSEPMLSLPAATSLSAFARPSPRTLSSSTMLAWSHGVKSLVSFGQTSQMGTVSMLPTGRALLEVGKAISL